jgi:hypothetical protein
MALLGDADPQAVARMRRSPTLLSILRIFLNLTSLLGAIANHDNENNGSVTFKPY